MTGLCDSDVRDRSTRIARATEVAQVRQRFLAKVVIDADSGCWDWTGAVSAKGYGRFSLNGRNRLAYHVAYELFIGPVPDDCLQFDHLCRNRACVNPEHIERVTAMENSRRGVNAQRDKTHCKHGHAFTEENTYLRTDGARGCRTCQRASWHRWNDRRPEPWNGKRRAELSIR